MWFSSGAPSEDVRRRVAAMRRRQRPDNEVPVSVAIDAVLAETPDFVLYISGFQVFRAALEFRLTALSRRSRRGQQLGSLLRGHGEENDRLLLGVQYADGRTGSNVGGIRGGTDLDPDAPVLMPGGGHGGERSADLSFSLSPLPPAGPLLFIAAWSSRGIAETVTEIAADRFSAAAAGVRVLWEPEPDELPAAPQPPPVPPGGWFERNER